MSWKVEKPVVVPFDFSKHAMAAVEKGIELAEAPELVCVMHVLPFLTPTEPGVGWGLISDSDRLEQTYKAMQKSLGAPKYKGLVLEVRFGDPGSVAAQRAEELDAVLMVVGSHGRTGISRLVLGSVAERVARLSPCPVLIVKLPAIAEGTSEPAEAKTEAQEPSDEEPEDRAIRKGVVVF